MKQKARLWRNRDYALWFVGDFAADGGNAIRSFAMPLIAYAVTGSLSLAGVVGAVGSGAMVLATLPGGLIADRYDRKRTLLLFHAFGVLVWGAGAALFLLGALSTAALLALAALGGIRSGLGGGVSNAALKQLVTGRQLPAAMAANQAREATIALGSGPAGGALLALSTAAPLVAQSVGHALAWCATLGIRADLRVHRDGPPASWRAQLVEGFTWLRSNVMVWRIILVLAVVNLGLNGLLTALILSLRADGVSAPQIGLLTTAMGAGMLAGSAAASWLTDRVPTGRLTIAGMLWVALWWAGAAYPLSMTALLVVGFCGTLALPIINAGLGGYLMAIVPNTTMGAVMAAMQIVNMGLLPLAPLLAGVGLDLAGRTLTLVAFAALTLVGSLVVVANKPLRRIPTPDAWPSEPQSEPAS